LKKKEILAYEFSSVFARAISSLRVFIAPRMGKAASKSGRALGSDWHCGDARREALHGSRGGMRLHASLATAELQTMVRHRYCWLFSGKSLAAPRRTKSLRTVLAGKPVVFGTRHMENFATLAKRSFQIMPPCRLTIPTRSSVHWRTSPRQQSRQRIVEENAHAALGEPRRDARAAEVDARAQNRALSIRAFGISRRCLAPKPCNSILPGFAR